LITLDFGLTRDCLSILKTSGAIVSQLQHAIHKLGTTSTKRFGWFLGSFVFSNSSLGGELIVPLYFSQNFFSYCFHQSGSDFSKSFVYLPQSSSGVFPGEGPHLERSLKFCFFSVTVSV